MKALDNAAPRGYLACRDAISLSLAQSIFEPVNQVPAESAAKGRQLVSKTSVS